MRPRLNGKVERSHRIDAEEFYRLLNGVVIDDAGLFNEKLLEWEHFYNYARPHGSLGGQTPYERLHQKTTRGVTRPRQSHKCGSPGDRTLNLRIKRPKRLDPLISDFACYPCSGGELRCQLVTSNHAYSPPSTW